MGVTQSWSFRLSGACTGKDMRNIKCKVNDAPFDCRLFPATLECRQALEGLHRNFVITTTVP